LSRHLRPPSVVMTLTMPHHGQATWCWRPLLSLWQRPRVLTEGLRKLVETFGREGGMVRRPYHNAATIPQRGETMPQQSRIENWASPALRAYCSPAQRPFLVTCRDRIRSVHRMTSTSHQAPQPGKYRHYKGGLYEV